MIYFLQNKSDTLKATKKFLADSSLYGKVKCIRSDNGTEFTSGAFESLLIQHCIKHEKSVPYSPHQNGTVERIWRTIFDMARCLLIEAKLAKTLWTYAVMAAVFIRNRCYNPRLKKTLQEAFTKQKPNLQNMHIFGTICYTYVQDKKKLDARGERGIFLGYDRGSPAYLVYFPENGTIKRVRCVIFTDQFEDIKDLQENPKLNVEDKVVVDLPPCSLDPEPTHEGHDVVVPEIPVDDANNSDRPDLTINNENGEAQLPETRYPKRDRVKPKYLEHYTDGSEIDQNNCINFTVDYRYKMSDIPQTYQEAISSPRSHEWQKAMEEEMHALRQNDTFQLTTIPKDRNVVGGRWVYVIKTGPSGEEKCKARFVAKGYSQIPNIDYHETFSPTAKMTSIRILMQLAVQYNFTVHQVDVKTGYLNAPIDRELYVDQPEGFTVTGRDGEHLVYKLKKSLYGLKQSGRNWNGVLHSYLVSQGFVQSQADNCFYMRITDESITIVIIWVDDIIIASNCTDVLKSVKDNLSERFQMKDMGKLSWFLGIEFVCEEGIIKMNQTKYIERVFV